MCGVKNVHWKSLQYFVRALYPWGGVLPRPMREAFPITHVHAYVCTCVRLSVPHAKETWKCNKCLTNYADTTKSNTPMFDCFVQPGLLDVRKQIFGRLSCTAFYSWRSFASIRPQRAREYNITYYPNTTSRWLGKLHRILLVPRCCSGTLNPFTILIPPH